MKGEAVTLNLVRLSPFLSRPSPATAVVVGVADLHTPGVSLLEEKDGGGGGGDGWPSSTCLPERTAGWDDLLSPGGGV